MKQFTIELQDRDAEYLTQAAQKISSTPERYMAELLRMASMEEHLWQPVRQLPPDDPGFL